MKEKDELFTKLWDSLNGSKRDQFRNLMRSKLEARKVPFTRENALRFWSGDYEAPPPRDDLLGQGNRGYRQEGGPPRGRRPPRRGPRGASHRTNRAPVAAPEKPKG